MEKRPSAINAIWLAMILMATLVAAYTGKMEATTAASFQGAKDAVTIAIGLIGVMSVWLGIMKVAEAGGLLRLIARALRPVMIRLFPDVPADHPAMSAMILNFATNAMGLGVAATPIGIKAMTELQKINQRKDTASDAMCLFLAINTSHLALLPTGVMSVRAAAGCTNPAAILLPSILAPGCAMVVAVILAKYFARRQPMPSAVLEAQAEPGDAPADLAPPDPPADLVKVGPVGRGLAWGVLAALALAVPYRVALGALQGELVFDRSALTAIMHWLVPVLMCLLLLYGYLRGVRIYETLTDGAKEGFQVAIRIVPFLAAIFVAIAMLRASGTLEAFGRIVGPFTSVVGMPTEVLPMVFLRPLSGSGAFGFMAELTQQAPEGFAAYLAAVMQGSTETTFYVLAVYFGAVGIRRIRYALTVGLAADATGFAAALVFAHLFF